VLARGSSSKQEPGDGAPIASTILTSPGCMVGEHEIRTRPLRYFLPPLIGLIQVVFLEIPMGICNTNKGPSSGNWDTRVVFDVTEDMVGRILQL